MQRRRIIDDQIVRILREVASDISEPGEGRWNLLMMAADRIERLTARDAALDASTDLYAP